jgi:hypothetical protein
VAFNRHRGGILEKLEREQARRLLKQKSQKENKDQKMQENTIELISEEEEIIN